MCHLVRVKVTVAAQSLWDYEHGKFVQDAFPDLTSDEREAVFMSGTCPTCWDEMFAEDDEF